LQPPTSLILVEILFGNVILRNLAGANSALAGSIGMFDTGDHVSLESIPLLEQFVNAF
jgi:hypothetical protein